MAIMPTVAIAAAYFRFDCFLGWLASDRFLRHLPDFVLSRSFDHLPSFTVGTGIVFNQVSTIITRSEAREMLHQNLILLFSVEAQYASILHNGNLRFLPLFYTVHRGQNMVS